MKLNFIKNNYNKYIIYIFVLLIALILLLILSVKFELFTNNLNDLNDINDYILPKIIWLYWDSEELPHHIQLIFNNNKTILGNEWKFNFLNNKTLSDYLDINSFPKNYESLRIQHKADYIRLKLISKYGGIWMDASIIVNLKENFDKIYNDTINNKYEITLFTLFDKDESFAYHQYIENWFIIAPKDSKLILLWLEEYENAINMGFDEYENYIKNNSKIILSNDITKSGTYLTQHRALQVVLQTKINWKPHMQLLRSEETMFKILSECKFNNECVKENIERQNNKDIKNIPYLKIISAGNNINFDNYFLS